MNFEIIHNNIRNIEEQIADNIVTNNNDKLLTELIKNNKHIPKISLLGKSGDGKSSLLNTILGKKKFLDTGTGCAVTSCPCTIQYGETAKFYIEYEDLDNISSNELKSHILSRIPKKHKLTEDKLNMLWNKHYELLKNKLSEQIAEFNEIYPSNYIENKKISKIIKHYKTETELTEDLTFKILPLITKISLHLPCAILKKMTLVDLPGLNDSCKYRIERTKNFLENETDFIAIVNDCNRITSDSFIDNNINSYIINSIIRNNIKDILIIGTMTDKLRKEIVEDYDDSDDSDDNDDDDDNDCENRQITNKKSEIINTKFKNKLYQIKNDLEEKITNNANLSLKGINADDIHIILTSSTLKNAELSGFGNFKNKLNQIVDCRNCKIEQSLINLIQEIYNDFDDYINRPTNELNQDNKSLIEKEYEKLSIKLNPKFLTDNMKIQTDIFTLNSTINIKKGLEKNKIEMIKYVHGKTASAILQKLQHTTCHNIKYDVKEDIISEIHTSFLKYIQNKLTLLQNKIEQTNKIYKDSSYILNSDLHQTFKKLYIGIYDLEDFKKTDNKISNLFKGITIEKNALRKSLNDIIKIESLNLISQNVIELVEEYKNRANYFSGVGTSNEIRKLFMELYTDGINNVCNKLNGILYKSFNSLLIDEELYYLNNINELMKSLQQKYIKNSIDYNNISKSFEELKYNMKIN